MNLFLEKNLNLPRKLPIFTSTNEILLPACIKTLLLNDDKNKILLQSTLNNVKTSTIFIGVAPSTKIGAIGTVAFVHRVMNNAVVVSGFCRFIIDKIIMEEPYIVAEVTQVDKHTQYKEIQDDPQVSQLTKELQDGILSLFDGDTSTVIKESLNKLPFYLLPEISSHLIKLNFDDQLLLLNTLDLTERLKLSITFIKRKDPRLPKMVMSIPKMPNALMRSSHELTDLDKRLKASNFPPEVERIATRDFQSLSRIPPYNPEYGVIFSYLNLLIDLPWNKYAEETLNLRKARDDLEMDHYGLEKVKRRILEYLAVKKLRDSVDGCHQGPILCLVGPPGVGKTSIARSIASTLNRPFIRVSLGGVSHMSDIRGHRRTYVGAMPGRIIQAIKQSAVKNPVILLDEIEKMTYGLHGNPAAALLEVLDPSQNKEFTDNYLNVPFDLSQVLFIATANSVQKLTPALYDRLEIIKITGYTYLEKIQIALSHLLPKQFKENGITSEQINIPDETIQLLINNYTREAGVRELERKIGSLCRSVAVRIALNEQNEINQLITIDIESAKEILGPVLWENNKWTSRLGRPGVAVGLVVTNYGGDTLAVESSFMPGTGKLILTGSLGDVMKESARLAWGWVRSNAYMYGVDLDGKRLSNMDVHIHFPEGAVSKDGPSAGVTIAVTLMSLFLGRPLLQNVAMTGEITLQGLVLPVGGIKEKVIAAHKDGFTKIILPQLNAKNLHDIPLNVKNDLTFVLVSDMHSIMESAFEDGLSLILPECLKSKL